MRQISFVDVVTAVKNLCPIACCDLPDDIFAALKDTRATEQSGRGREILDDVIKNAEIAKRERLPICQDTGFASIFVERGEAAMVDGLGLNDALIQGIRQGYTEAYLRPSMVSEPVFRRINTRDNTPPIIHVDIVPGDSLKITLLPKGAGCENMGALAYLKPADGIEGLKSFVVNTIIRGGGNPCPPAVIGVGIGGTGDMAMVLSKKALLRKLGSRHPDPDYARLEEELYDEINRTGVGPQGLGGSSTALGVHIETYPTHIASMPVGVSINCHAARQATVVL